MEIENKNQIPFDEKDIQQILKCLGYSNESVFIDRRAMSVLVEMGKVFIEEVIDLHSRQGKQIDIEDCKRSIELKFPEIADKQPKRSIQILQKRVNQIDSIDNWT